MKSKASNLYGETSLYLNFANKAEDIIWRNRLSTYYFLRAAPYVPHLVRWQFPTILGRSFRDFFGEFWFLCQALLHSIPGPRPRTKTDKFRTRTDKPPPHLSSSMPIMDVNRELEGMPGDKCAEDRWPHNSCRAETLHSSRFCLFYLVSYPSFSQEVALVCSKLVFFDIRTTVNR